MQDDRDGQTTNGYANTTEVWKVLTRSRFDMWTPRMGGKWLQANKCLFVHEMKLKSSKAFEDLLMLSIMTAWKMLMEEVHWMQLSSPMEWAHQPLVWNPNITYVRSRMLGMEVRTPWVYFEKQWWPTMAKWWKHQHEISNIMEIGNIKQKKMIIS